ncbi:hypothetical protein EUA06_11170 [Nocardioides glacieisoli]|uniref:Uncharacterized protein n=1 Tax=Nocardioides glacieisoli TaxID=1168730 RepID=A0A4Q2RSS6_9ACTN|nr:hypothetical protein [Nocardioides glacieisoli]RYB90829.1 hypothetical protein EUA06_11170 [Nocardioides glacieisoli]
MSALRVVPTTLEITCPHWCNSDPQRHADDLWNQGGCVIHTLEEIRIGDADGFDQGAFEDPREAEPIEVGLSALTTPSNKPQASPVIFINGTEVTVAQAELLAGALLEVVALTKEVTS